MTGAIGDGGQKRDSTGQRHFDYFRDAQESCQNGVEGSGFGLLSLSSIDLCLASHCHQRYFFLSQKFSDLFFTKTGFRGQCTIFFKLVIYSFFLGYPGSSGQVP